tara:strand:- start:1355 stop:1795 length:441 start_codon:yes stop_codon:yes gene_type:complete
MSSLTVEQVDVTERAVAYANKQKMIFVHKASLEGDGVQFSLTKYENSFMEASDSVTKKVSNLYVRYVQWWSLEKDLERLQTGNCVFEDGTPFFCYRALINTPLQADFLNAWSSDIGRFGAHIHNLSGVLEESWEDSTGTHYSFEYP